MPNRKSAMKAADAAQSTSNATFAPLVQPRDVQMPTMHIGGTRNAQPPSAMYRPRSMGPQRAVDAPTPSSVATLAVTTPTPPRFVRTTGHPTSKTSWLGPPGKPKDLDLPSRRILKKRRRSRIRLSSSHI
jgi:hypothetical protein